MNRIKGMVITEEQAEVFAAIIAAGLSPEFILGRLRDETRYEIERYFEGPCANKDKYDFYRNSERILDAAYGEISN